MQRIPIYGRIKGRNGTVVAEATIDNADVPLTSQHRWNLLTTSRGAYALSTTGILMHRLILGLNPNDPDVDHRDGNGLNNQRSNLRLASPSQNGGNRRPNIRQGSRFKGVKFHKGSWIARCNLGGKRVWLGSFESEEAAARAYDKAALAAYGDFALTNFPPTI